MEDDYNFYDFLLLKHCLSRFKEIKITYSNLIKYTFVNKTFIFSLPDPLGIQKLSVFLYFHNIFICISSISNRTQLETLVILPRL